MRWILLPAGLTVLFCGALAAIAAPIAAQDTITTQSSSGVTQVSNLIGATVSNLQNQTVGQIKDVLLDSSTGQASFVVLNAKIAGSGRAMLVVPFQALKITAKPEVNRQEITLDLRPEHLQSAPQIRNSQWQVLQNPQFLEDARNFYQPRTYVAARPIDNATMPPPCPPTVNSEPDWSRDLNGFYNE
jgi:hypothetical protein